MANQTYIHKFKRFIAFMLALIFIFNFVMLPNLIVSASIVTNVTDKFIDFLDKLLDELNTITKIPYNAFQVLLDVLNGKDIDVITMTLMEFLKLFEEEIQTISTIDFAFRLDDGRLVYSYLDYNSIQIGEYVFPRFHSGSTFTNDEINQYKDVFNTYNTNNTLRSEYIIFPFFIYNDDFYVNNTPTNFYIWNGQPDYIYMITRGTDTFYSTAINNHDNQHTKFDWRFTPYSDNSRFVPITHYYSRMISVTTGEVGYIQSGEWEWNNSDQWYNLSGFLRGEGELRSTITQILGITGDIGNVTNFPNAIASFGMFTVLPTFYEQSGMRFNNYIRQLLPNELYVQQPPTESRGEIELPEELQDLNDDDIIEISLDEDGNIVINVIRDDETLGGIMGILQKILAELKKITKNTKGLDGGGGSTIWDFLSTLIDLPAKLAQAITDIFPNFDFTIDFAEIINALSNLLKPLLDFVENMTDKAVDLLTLIFIPSEGFMESSFGNLQDNFYLKIPILIQGEGLFNEFIGILSNLDNEETIDFNIHGEMFGIEVDGSFLDKKFFDEYLPYIHAIIVSLAWIGFVRKVVKKIPGLIGGISS